jgi:glycosyltransferase involved in cell wall biosynthesis
MKINIVMGGISRESGTAGHAMLFGYANGLLERGHEVSIVTTVPGYQPQWYDLRAPIIQPKTPSPLSAGVRTALRYGRFRLGLGSTDKTAVKAALNEVTASIAPWSALPYRRASGIERLSLTLPPADITMATGAPTAFPVFLLGTGTKVYFMQGYETYFAVDPDPRWQRVYELECELSYKLPMHRIANCSWLADTVCERHGGEAELCLNALDHGRFFPEGRAGPAGPLPEGRAGSDGQFPDGHAVPAGPFPDGNATPAAPLTVASYSGRGAALKGFADAAQAIRLVRSRVGEVRWRVFGEDAELPPDNPIAPYESIGVVDAPAIRRLYSEADVALCPAWHDAFPMYPMEAMACGCAVVSTGIGVEDYAQDEHNALIVSARDSEAMADAIVRLDGDVALRARLVEQALRDVKDFTWERSLDRMEELLKRFHESADPGPSVEDPSVSRPSVRPVL